MSGSNSRHHRQISVPMDLDDHVDVTQGTASTENASASQDAFQQHLNTKIMEDLFARMSRCHSLGELLKTIPAPAQNATKDILEKVTDAFTRQGACEVVKTTWQDALNKREYDNIPELNSLRAPSVQVSKLAQEVDPIALKGLNFDSNLTDAKKAALTTMIGIKQQEINNLNQLCKETIIRRKVVATWKDISDENGITPEHLTILLSKGCAERLVQMAISIGHDSLIRSANIKKKRLEKKEEAEQKKTEAADDPKSMRALIQEELKRARQSEKDKKISKKEVGGRDLPKPRKTRHPAPRTAPQRCRRRAPQTPENQGLPPRGGKRSARPPPSNEEWHAAAWIL
ncbi:hypothetical protein M3J09_013926 [Ascochyta lentis]